MIIKKCSNFRKYIIKSISQPSTYIKENTSIISSTKKNEEKPVLCDTPPDNSLFNLQSSLVNHKVN